MPDPNAGIDRLEDSMGRAFNAIEALAGKQEQLDNVVTLLAEAQIKTKQRFQEAAERSQQTDARIGKLVSPIGELIRNGRAKWQPARSGHQNRPAQSTSYAN